MHKLRSELIRILSGAQKPKSVEAEADLILFHYFRDQMRTPNAIQVSREIMIEAREIAVKRSTGIPLQHLLGYQYFYEHEYEVTPAVLIPRPETEILVQAALQWCETREVKTFAELGLGSGAISGELLAARPGLKGVASETSQAAAAVADRNLKRILGESYRERLEILLVAPSAAFETFLPAAPLDLVVSNPPYVGRDEEIEDEVLYYEPAVALFPDSGMTGRDPDFFYQDFFDRARALLDPDGAAFFEIPHPRDRKLESLAREAGLQTELIPDLTGRSRVLKCTF